MSEENDSVWAAPKDESGAPSVHEFPERTRIGMAVMAALALTVVTSILATLSNIVFESVPEDSTLGILAAFGLLFGGLGMIAGYLAQLPLWMYWQYTTATKLQELGRDGMQYTPGWHVGWWFVPFANLVAPFRAMKELWQASDPDSEDPDWNLSAVPGWFPLWWGCWLSGNILSNASTRMQFRAGMAEASAYLDMIATPLSVVATVFFIVQVSTIDARMSKLAARKR